MCLAWLCPAGIPQTIELTPNIAAENILIQMAPFDDQEIDKANLAGPDLFPEFAKDRRPKTENTKITTGTWYAVRLHNNGTEPASWRLSTILLRPGRFKALQVKADNTAQILLNEDYPAGDMSILVSQGPILSSPMLTFKAGEEIALWIHIEDGSFASQFPFRLLPEQQFFAEQQQREMLHGFYYGAFIVLLLFFISFAFILQTKTSLVYGAYLSATVFLNFNSYGYLSEMFSNYRELHFSMFPLLHIIVSVLYAVFAVSFLRIQTRMPKTYLLIISYLTIYSAISLLAFFFPTNLLVLISNIAFGGVMIMGLWIVGVAGFSRAPGSIFFTAGFLIFMLRSYLNISSNGYHEAANTFKLDLYTIALQLVDAVIFGIAIVLQSRAMGKERDASVQAQLAATRQSSQLEKDLRSVRAHQERLTGTRHDLRQPLTSLRLAADNTADPVLAEKLRAGLDYITAVLDPIQEIAVQETHEAQPETEKINLQIIFDNLNRIYIDEASTKGLDLIFQPTELVIETKVVALIRTLSNLLSNAIKYTRTGQVTVCACVSNDSIRIDVKDTGPGIEAGDITRLLNKHERGAGVKNISGEGLGLAIVSEHASQLGLELQAESTPGVGSTFSITGLSIA